MQRSRALKGCLIVIAVVLVFTMLAVGAAWYYADRHYGISVAPQVSHERFVEEDTRLRAMLQPDLLVPLMMAVQPEDSPELPVWLPTELQTLVEATLPREASVLGGADYMDGRYRFTVFFNERRGGPEILRRLLATPPAVPADAALQWEEPLLRQPERGVLLAEGALPIPTGAEDFLLRYWGHDEADASLALEGGHLFEAMLDNRAGELFVLITAYMQANGQEWERLMDDSRSLPIMEILTQIKVIRLAANLDGTDRLVTDVTIEADPAAEDDLRFFLPLIMAFLKEEAAARELTLESEFAWSTSASAMEGEIVLSGFESHLREHVRATLTEQGLLIPSAPANGAPTN